MLENKYERVKGECKRRIETCQAIISSKYIGSDSLHELLRIPGFFLHSNVDLKESCL